MNMLKNNRRNMLFIPVVAFFFALICIKQVFFAPDHYLSDTIYQRAGITNEEIVLIEIDQKAIQEYGPVQDWSRDIITNMLRALNQSETVHPAVIGIDILYSGETEKKIDDALVEAAGSYENVVLGSLVYFGNVYSIVGGEIGRNQFTVLSYEEPFDALRNVTIQGHMNCMLDTDGILRHHIWEINCSDDKNIPSFAQAVASCYVKNTKQEKIQSPRTDANGFWYMDYSAEPGDFSEHISIVDVINGDYPADYFADKIVLVGFFVPGFQDQYITSIDHSQSMYGIECHANAIQTILNQNYKTEVSDILQAVVVFLILTMFGMLIYKRKMIISTFIFVGLFFISALVCLVSYQQGYVLHVLWLPLGLILFYVTNIVYQYLHSVYEKRRVAGLFKKYLAPEVVNEILSRDNAEELIRDGHLIDIAVLFVDIRGFTAMSEFMNPNEIVEILNRYLTFISDCIFEQEGTLDKFIGDAAMAFWGAPIPQEDYVMKAVKAAIAMKEGAEKLSKDIQEKYGKTLSFGIGIHVGKALVGNIGSVKRMDYTAIGDTVNTASRLESIAPKNTIYLSKEVIGRLGNRIQCEKLSENIVMKGKTEPMEVYFLTKVLDK